MAAKSRAISARNWGALEIHYDSPIHIDVIHVWPYFDLFCNPDADDDDDDDDDDDLV